MDLKTLKATPPWDWPPNAGKLFLNILADSQADASDRILAAALAGDYTVIDDALVEALLSVLVDGGESEKMRRSKISNSRGVICLRKSVIFSWSRPSISFRAT